jgi:hypothetical protein
MIEAKPETLIGDRAYDSDPLDDELRKDGIEMVAPHDPSAASAPRKMDDGFGDMPGAGWLNASSPGYNSSVAFVSAGSFIRRTSLASCRSPASSSSSDDFEIGSSISRPSFGAVAMGFHSSISRPKKMIEPSP